MKITGLLILLTAGLFTGPAVADTHYSVKIDGDLPRRAHVTAQVVPGDQGLCLTRAAHDTGLTHGWATFVHELSVNDSNGNPLTVDYDGDGCWRIAATAGSITAEYTVLLNHDRFPNDPGDDELAYAGDWGQFWTGRALFMEGASAVRTTVDFALPEGWAVTAPWPPANESGLSFAPPDADALFDSGFMLGTHASRQFTQGDAVIHIGLAGAGPEARGDELVAILQGTLSEFSALHQASPNGDLAVFLGQGRLVGGGVMGQTISMLVVDDVPDELMPMLTYIVTHEVFHLWNANLTYASQPDMYWFSEGFAEYYTFRALQAQGLMDASALLATLEERESLYLDVAGEISMVDAGEEKLDHYDLIYSGGMMAALALDMQILEASGGHHRLDDVMPDLYAQFGPGSEVRLDLSTLAKHIEAQTDVDTRDFLRRHVAGLEIIQAEPLRAQLAGTL
jgi:predicted metalloprotease with PDZ domain